MPVDGDAGANLRQVLRRCDIKIRELAVQLGVTDKAVWRQMQVAQPRADTLARYTAAINALLAQRDDPRRYSPEGLLRGAEPLTGSDVQQLAETLVSDSLVQRVAVEVLRRVALPAAPTGLRLRVHAAGQVDDAQPLLPSDTIELPATILGAEANEDNCLVIRLGHYDDAMAGAGLHHGAAVVVRRDLRPREGDIVLAHLPGQLVLRRWTGERLASEPLAGHAQVTPAEQIISLLGVAMLVWQRLR